MRFASLAVVAALCFAGCDDSPDPIAPDEAATLVRTADEAASAACPGGATVVTAGPDRDGDGALDADEVAETKRICNPVGATTPTLARRDAEPAGAHCAAGGTAVRSGRDRDGDGALADGEIESTTYVCAADEVIESG